MSQALLKALAQHGMSVGDLRRDWENCVDKDVTERPPRPGITYKAFVVHPRRPGPQTLAIGHCEGDTRVVDLLRDRLTIAEAVELCKAYGIDKVTGQELDDPGVNLIEATAGLISVLAS